MTIDQMNEDMRLVERTRLLRNSAVELDKLLDSKTSQGNSLVRKGGKSPVMRRAMYALLTDIARTECNLDLGEVIAAYRHVDALLDGVRVHNPHEACGAIIAHRFHNSPFPVALAPLEAVADGEIAVAMLVLLGVLPRLNANSGDIHDFAALYATTMEALRSLPSDGIAVRTLPLMMRVEEDYAAGRVNSRLALVAIANDVLDAYHCIMLPHRSLEENMHALRDESLPDIDGLYQNQNKDTTFWRVTRVENAYFMYHYRTVQSARRLECTRLTMKLFGSVDKEMLALVTHPRLIVDVLAGHPLNERYFAYLGCRLDEKGVFTFKPKLGAYKWFTRDFAERLIPVTDKRFFERKLKSFTIVDTCPEVAYDFVLTLQSITRDAIVIGDGHGGSYVIPKRLRPTFDAVDFSQSIGVLTMHDKTYIAFDEHRVYIDVSTPELLAASGITHLPPSEPV